MAIISNVPIWVWFILVFVIYRGYKLSQESVVNIQSNLIIFGIILVFGISRVISLKHDAVIYAGVYILSSLLLSVVFSRVLDKLYSFMWVDDKLVRSKSYLPMIMIIFMFISKFTFAFIDALNLSFTNSVLYVVIYALISSLSTGFFLGTLMLVKSKLSK